MALVSGAYVKAARAVVLFTVCLSAIVIACGGNGNPARPKIVIYAAASTMDLMTEAAALFSESSGIDAVFEFSSSGSLARKIEAGSPTDIYISANQRWIDYAVQKQLVDSAGSFVFARNSLVCVEPLGGGTGITSAAGLAAVERLSIGDPQHVPAGSYARQALEHYGLWDQLGRDGKIVLAVNVRAALSNVEQGDVSAGIVYATDAARSSRVRVLFTLDEQSHKSITYHAALVSVGSRKQEAGRFMQFLSSEQFLALLDRYGFKRP
jgi:molybdate transport system substrate-binding protein